MDYRSKFSGPIIDEAVAKMFQFDIRSNGCIKLVSSKTDPYDLNYLLSPGNYVVYYFINGSKAMESVTPMRLYVGYWNDTLCQMAMIMDFVQFRKCTDLSGKWTDWETWYSTGYIYQQPEEPVNPQKDALWIDTSDIMHPVMKVYSRKDKKWEEVRPSDTMDVSIYDPRHIGKDVYQYIEDRIMEVITLDDGKSFADEFAFHVSDNVIHFNRWEKNDFMDRPSRSEVETNFDETKKDIEDLVNEKIKNTVAGVDEIINRLKEENGSMMVHYNDTVIHTTAEEKAYWNSKAEKTHTHNLDGKVKINASNVVEGVFRLDQLPASIYEIVVKVSTDAERFQLKREKGENDPEGTKYVQNGDTVYVEDTLSFYFVTNDDYLSSESGYTKYSALLPETIEWNRIINTPKSRDGYQLLDVPTYTEMNTAIEKSDMYTVEYITSVFARCASIPNISGYVTLPNDPYAVTSLEMLGSKIIYVIPEQDDFDIYVYDMTDKIITLENPYLEINGNRVEAEQCFFNEFESPNIEVSASICPAYKKYASKTVICDHAIIHGSVSDEILQSGAIFAYNSLTHEMFIVSRTFTDNIITSGEFIKTSFVSGIYTAFFKGALYCYREYNGEWKDSTQFKSTTDNALLASNPEVFMWGELDQDDTTIFAHECVILHNRTRFGIFRLLLDDAVFNRYVDVDMSLSGAETAISLGNDYIILQTLVHDNNLYVLTYYVADKDSEINLDWKAFSLKIVVFRYDLNAPELFLSGRFEITDLTTLHEVGSDMEEDYSTLLDQLYRNHIETNPLAQKEIKMAVSNDAFIIYYNGQPFFSVLMSAWSNMYTSIIDTRDNTIKKDTIVASQVYQTSIPDEISPTTLCITYEGKSCISYDGYNFYLLEDKSIYANDTSVVQVMKNIVLDNKQNLLLKMDATNTDTIAYGILYNQTTIDNNIIYAIDEITNGIKEKTGALSTNLLYTQFEGILNTPVNITGEDNPLVNVHFIRYDEDFPSYYYRFNLTGGNSSIKIPATINAPFIYDHAYIKGGFYQNTQYIFAVFTHDDGSIPEIGFGIISSMSVSILSYTQLSCMEGMEKYLIDRYVNGIRIKTYKVGNEIYGYTEFTINQVVEGLPSYRYYPIAIANYETGQIRMKYIEFNDEFYTEGQITSIIRMYKKKDQIFIVRANNALYTAAMFQKGDNTGINNYIYMETNYDMLNPSPIKNLPEPFLIDSNFAFAYTNNDGNLYFTIMKQDGTIDKITSTLKLADNTGDVKKQYQVWMDENTNSMIIVHVGTFSQGIYSYYTDDILIYLLIDTSELESGGGIQYRGKISNSVLKGYTINNKSFSFPEILPVYSNYNYGLLCASWFNPISEDISSFGNTTPLITIARDTGPETLRRVYDLTTTYIKKLNEYQDKFESLQDQISNCTEYADSILELIG